MDVVLWNFLERLGVFKNIYKKPSLNDEPRIPGFGVEINTSKVMTEGDFPDISSSGTSVVKRTAILKAIFEGLERFSLAEFRFKEFIFSSYGDVSKLSASIHPNNFCYFSPSQLKQVKLSNFSFSDKSKFYWTKCKDFITGKFVFLPSQIIYCPYKYKDGEKVITFPVTTGASIAESLEDSLYRGFCEDIERDAYMTNYLLKLEPDEISLGSINSLKINKLLSKFRKYNLEVKSYILVSDFNIPTVLSVIVDRTEKGPALCLGLKTDLDLDNAIIGSIEEAFQIRLWIRIVMIKNEWVGDTYTSSSMLKRAFLWKDLKNIKNFNFVLKTKKVARLSDHKFGKFSNKTPTEKLELIKNEFVRLGMRMYYKDVTSNGFKKMGLTVVKCVSPDLHPMFINQDFPYLGGKRIQKLMKEYDIKSLNLYPHPFL